VEVGAELLRLYETSNSPPGLRPSG
jgi:hypothetical protein